MCVPFSELSAIKYYADKFVLLALFIVFPSKAKEFDKNSILLFVSELYLNYCPDAWCIIYYKIKLQKGLRESSYLCTLAPTM